MRVQRGHIVLVVFPFSDQTGSKVRPALVVQNDHWNRLLDDTLLALITSSSRRFLGSPTQKLVVLGTPDSVGTGLRSDSVIECQTLATYDCGLILSLIGRLPPATMQDVDGCVRVVLGL
jgi:mRNA interferase MazF